MMLHLPPKLSSLTVRQGVIQWISLTLDIYLTDSVVLIPAEQMTDTGCFSMRFVVFYGAASRPSQLLLTGDLK